MNKVRSCIIAFSCFFLFADGKCLAKENSIKETASQNSANHKKSTSASTDPKITGSSRASAQLPAKTVTEPAIVTKDGKPIWLNFRLANIASKSKNKPIFADFYTDWCGWCKYMDRTTFHDPKVQDYLAKNFVCMRVNAEDGADGQDLALLYRIAGYPTLIVIDPHGKTIGQFEGYRNPEQLLAFAKKSLASRPQAAGPKDP